MRAQRTQAVPATLTAFMALGYIACGGTTIVTETANPVEQTAEINPINFDNGAESANNVTILDQVDSNIGADTSVVSGLSAASIHSTVAPVTTSTVVDSTSTTNAASTTATSRELSPAWIESKAIDSIFNNPATSSWIEDSKLINDYMSNNPNDTSAPMGALCWAYHELNSGFYISASRDSLDYFLIPFFATEAGMTSEQFEDQFGPPGPEATGALLDMLSNNEAIDDIDFDADDLDDLLEQFRIMHQFADGEAWAEAVRAVASPALAVAFRADGGLPAEVQTFAVALTDFAKEHVGQDLESAAENLFLPDFPGLKEFIEVAKYHPDCKRAQLEDQ